MTTALVIMITITMITQITVMIRISNSNETNNINGIVTNNAINVSDSNDNNW